MRNKLIHCKALGAYGIKAEHRLALAGSVQWVEPSVLTADDHVEVGFRVASHDFMFAKAGELRAALGIEREEGGK